MWLSWFTDSVALWQRQEETPYLIDDPASSAASLSPNLDPHQISSDPEPDADDWDVEPGAEKSALELTDIDWNDINEEVEAAMNESDDDDTASRHGSVKSGMTTDDEDAMTDDSRSQDRLVHTRVRIQLRLNEAYTCRVDLMPRLKRKRLRSVTPSESSYALDQPDIMRSPLAKRKKLTASRTGMSKLKEAFTAEEIAAASRLSSRSNSLERRAPSPGAPNSINEGDVEEEEDDDFLARELGEEWC